MHNYVAGVISSVDLYFIIKQDLHLPSLCRTIIILVHKENDKYGNIIVMMMLTSNYATYARCFSFASHI